MIEKQIQSPKEKDEMLLRIARHLILNASFLTDLGLYHGKMGIILFLCEYSRYVQKPLYHDFAGVLLEEIYEDITKETPIHLGGGLAGIGWGIEYLVKNGFMNGDTDEVLNEMDGFIMKYDPARYDNLRFEEGLTGILFYVLTRLKSENRDQSTKPFDMDYLEALYQKAIRILNNGIPLEEPVREILCLYTDVYAQNQQITRLIPYIKFSGFKSDELGLENGWAGKGFEILNQENATNLYF